jgi:hypothetical protein
MSLLLEMHSFQCDNFLTEELAEELRQWNTQQELNYPANEWLFPGKGGVGPVKSHTFDLWARAISTKLGITFTPHRFRHSITTYLSNKMGCPDDDAGNLINHKSAEDRSILPVPFSSHTNYSVYNVSAIKSISPLFFYLKRTLIIHRRIFRQIIIVTGK